MSDDIDPTAWDPIDDPYPVDPGPFDYDGVPDASDPAHDPESSGPDPSMDDDAGAILNSSGGPLELPADPAGDAELHRWLDEPAPAAPTAREVAELDRLLRAALAPE
jgi:hypothetical protein